MKRGTALTKLKAHSRTLRAMGAQRLFLFGSTARNEAKVTSDLDIFIDIQPRKSFSLFDLMAMKRFLEETLKVEVDLMTRGSLHPLIKDRVTQSAVKVF